MVSRHSLSDRTSTALKNNYDITVAAKSVFIPEQSDESASRFVFAYTITITNTITKLTLKLADTAMKLMEKDMEPFWGYL